MRDTERESEMAIGAGVEVEAIVDLSFHDFQFHLMYVM